MVPIRSRITIRRGASFAGLAALLCMIVLGLSQCTLVDDRLTGVRLSPSRTAASSCLNACQKAAQQAMKTESALHVIRVKACDDAECLQAEQERHVQALHDIATAREACMNGCHQQGRGQGGD